MNSAPAIKEPAPICGVLSLAAPFVSVAIALVVDKVFQITYPGDQGRFFVAAWVMLPIFGGLVGGMVLAGLAAVRGEKLAVLRWVGFLLNAGPLAYWMIASHL